MLKMIIADDEEKVCKLIEKLINWKELEIELVGTANNGVEVLEMIERLDPDIVITDIRMPGLDGLEVIERVTKQERQVKFVVVSGYKYFEYAYNALKFGVEDYLLKPIQKSELNQILGKICVAKTEKEKMYLEQKNLKGERDRSLSLLQQSFMELLFEVPDNNQLEFDSLNERYQINFAGEVYWCFALNVDADNIIPMEEEMIHSFTQTLYKKMKKYFSDNAQVGKFVLGTYQGRIAGIMECNLEEDGEEILGKCFLQLLHFVDSFHGYFITMSVTEGEPDYCHMHRQIQTAYENLNARLFLGNNRMIKVSEIYQGVQVSEELLFTPSDRAELQACGTACDGEKLQSCLKDIFHRLNHTENLDFHIYYGVLDSLADTFYQSLEKEDGQDSRLTREANELKQKFRRFYQKPMLRNFTIKFISESMEKYVQRKNNQETRPVRMAKDYMNENFAKDIGLEEVARTVDLNPVYLSVLFKRSTGQNFNDYLTHVRIIESKRLLKETNETMATIASLVGYGNAKYFSQLFTKVVGINPTVYRKLHS